MQKSDIRFVGGHFCSSSSIFSEQVFIEFACNRSDVWHLDLNSWTLFSEKIAYKAVLTVRIRLAILGRLAFLVAHIGLPTFRFVLK